MRTVTYQSLLDRLAGYLGEADGLNTEDAALANAKINFFARLGWEYFFHPDLTPIERRTFRPAYSAAENLVAGDERYFIAANAYYVALRDQSPGTQAPATLSGGDYATNLAWWADAEPDPTGDDWATGVEFILGQTTRNPDDGLIYQCHTAHTAGASFDATKFGEVTAFVRSIAYEQTDETPLGDVRYIWDRNPEANRCATRLGFRLRTDAVQVLGRVNVCWVEFRLRVPSWTGAVRSDTATYLSGVTVFDAETGDFWTSNAAIAAAESPTTTPAKWDKIEFPYFLSEFVAQSAYAMLTNREEQLPENFNVQMAAGFPLLAAEIQKIERQQGQTRQLNVVR